MCTCTSSASQEGGYLYSGNMPLQRKPVSPPGAGFPLACFLDGCAVYWLERMLKPFSLFSLTSISRLYPMVEASGNQHERRTLFKSPQKNQPTADSVCRCCLLCVNLCRLVFHGGFNSPHVRRPVTPNMLLPFRSTHIFITPQSDPPITCGSFDVA